MRTATHLLFAALFCWLAAAIALDLTADRTPPAGTFGAVVVAGCRVLPSGAPSDCLRLRAEAGARLVLDGHAELLVLTGGVGDHPPSEAAAAARVARSMGVPAAAIILEDRSTSTEENAAFAAARLGGQTSVLIVTDAWHTHRTQRVFARYFAVADTLGVDATMQRRPRGALREVVALIYYALRGRV